MFVPLYDGVPMRRLKAPFVTYALILINVAVFAATAATPQMQEDFAYLAAGLGAIPSVIFGYEELPAGLPLVPAPATLVTSLFLHLSWMHVIGNMVVLFVFGDNVEDALGHWRFLAFYLLCGIAGGLAHAAMDLSAPRPLVGASSAVSGIIGAYLVLHPRVKVWGLILFRIPVRLRAAWGIALWAALQLWQIYSAGDTSTGWTAHLGGFAAGLALVFVMRPRDQPLFGAADGPDLTGER